MKRNTNPLFSVVLAVHNEEANLTRCLESIKSIADEIILVDGDSDDDSVKIARSFNAHVIQTSNKSNFHINKQMAMDAAEGKLILQLDADEVVDNQLVEFISSLVLQLKQNLHCFDSAELPKAWWIKRKNWFMGKFLTKGGQYPDSVIRLYLKGCARLPQKDVHEQMKVEGSVGWADGHLLHYSSPTLQDYFRKFNTYTSFSAIQLRNLKHQATFGNAVQYLIVKPCQTFFSVYLRHRGYVDGIPGFCFALLSAWHFPVSLVKWWELECDTLSESEKHSAEQE